MNTDNQSNPESEAAEVLNIVFPENFEIPDCYNPNIIILNNNLLCDSSSENSVYAADEINLTVTTQVHTTNCNSDEISPDKSNKDPSQATEMLAAFPRHSLNFDQNHFHGSNMNQQDGIDGLAIHTALNALMSGNYSPQNQAHLNQQIYPNSGQRMSSMRVPVDQNSLSESFYCIPSIGYYFADNIRSHETTARDDKDKNGSKYIDNPTSKAEISKSGISAISVCKILGCNNLKSKQSQYCTAHTGTRKCEAEGCTKCAQGSTKFCIAHGGGRRCTYPDCVKGARDKLFCAAHGGGRRCSYLSCMKSAVGGSTSCTYHGGGKKCKFDGCNKSAQSPTSYCVKHGGGKKCKFEKCAKVARGRTDYCAAHGGGVRCTYTNCHRAATSKMPFCRNHQSKYDAGINVNGSVIASSMSLREDDSKGASSPTNSESDHSLSASETSSVSNDSKVVNDVHGDESGASDGIKNGLFAVNGSKTHSPSQSIISSSLPLSPLSSSEREQNSPKNISSSAPASKQHEVRGNCFESGNVGRKQSRPRGTGHEQNDRPKKKSKSDHMADQANFSQGEKSNRAYPSIFPAFGQNDLSAVIAKIISDGGANNNVSSFHAMLGSANSSSSNMAAVAAISAAISESIQQPLQPSYLHGLNPSIATTLLADMYAKSLQHQSFPQLSPILPQTIQSTMQHHIEQQVMQHLQHQIQSQIQQQVQHHLHQEIKNQVIWHLQQQQMMRQQQTSFDNTDSRTALSSNSTMRSNAEATPAMNQTGISDDQENSAIINEAASIMSALQSKSIH